MVGQFVVGGERVPPVGGDLRDAAWSVARRMLTLHRGRCRRSVLPAEHRERRHWMPTTTLQRPTQHHSSIQLSISLNHCLFQVSFFEIKNKFPPNGCQIVSSKSFFDWDNELQIYFFNFLLTGNKQGKLVVIKQSKGCKWPVPKIRLVAGLHPHLRSPRSPSRNGAYF